MKKSGECVGVDEKYIPEDKKYVDDSILGNNAETEEKINSYVKKREKVAKHIGIGYLCFLMFIFALIIAIMIFGFYILNNVRKTSKEIINSEIEKYYFNAIFEAYSGTCDRLL